MLTLTISKKKLEKALDKFSNEVKEKKYKRISYVHWQHLKRWEADKVKTEIVFDPESNTVTCHGAVFPLNDNSFGEFLVNNYLNITEDYMEPKDNDTLNQIYSWTQSGNYATSLGPNFNQTNSTSVRVNSFDRVYDEYTGQSLTDTYVTKSELETRLATKEDKRPTENIKENKKMKGFNFDFGPCSNGAVKMSLYGMAVKNTAGTWVAYDKNSANIIDVDILNFDGAKFFYKMPVAIKDIKPGDVVIHNGFAMFVTTVPTNGNAITVIDPHAGEKKDILLTKSPFGFDFATKVVNLLDGAINTSADAANPFGNMWMLMLAGDNSTNNDLLPLMLMSQGGGSFDPMMLYFVLGNKGNNDILPLMLMLNANKTVPHSCTCGGNCSCAEADANS